MGDTEKESDEDPLGIGFADTRDVMNSGGPKDEELDAAFRGPPPLPEGLMAKGSQTASPGLDGERTPPCARFLAWKPFAINAASIHCSDTLRPSIEPERRPT